MKVKKFFRWYDVIIINHIGTTIVFFFRLDIVVDRHRHVWLLLLCLTFICNYINDFYKHIIILHTYVYVGNSAATSKNMIRQQLSCVLYVLSFSCNFFFGFKWSDMLKSEMRNKYMRVMWHNDWCEVDDFCLSFNRHICNNKKLLLWPFDCFNARGQKSLLYFSFMQKLSWWDNNYRQTHTHTRIYHVWEFES